MRAFVIEAPGRGVVRAGLVVSVRPVDHHVSAVLQKLGVPSRQAARAAAPDLLS